MGAPDVSTLSNSLTNGSVESALDNLRSLSDNAAKDAKNKVDNAVSSLEKYSKGISNEIDNIASKAQSQVNNTISSLSTDVQDCMNKNGNPGTAGLNAARDSGLRCVQNKVNEARSIADGAKDDIQKALLSVEYVRGNLSNCNLNVSMSLVSLPSFSATKPACIASVRNY